MNEPLLRVILIIVAIVALVVWILGACGVDTTVF